MKSVLLAAHLKVMGAVSGQRRFFTGLLANGRQERLDGDQVCGMFLNPVPFAVSLDAPTWLELVQSVFAEEVALWPHRRYPLPAMQREWGRGSPLFDVVFNYLDFHVLDRQALNLGQIIDCSPNEYALNVATGRGALLMMARSTCSLRRTWS